MIFVVAVLVIVAVAGGLLYTPWLWLLLAAAVVAVAYDRRGIR